MNSFVYDIPTKVYFGEKQLGHLAPELAKFGKKVLLCYGGGSIKKSGLYDRVTALLKEAGLELFELAGIDPNPRVSSVNEGAAICKKEGIDVLLAVGGGSVIDCTKMVGAASFYDGDAWDLLTGKAGIEKSLPIVNILTLAATGSEMDSFAVISNVETQDKLAAAHPCLLPKVAFLDPSLTYSVSRYQTACGSSDILSHVMEVYFDMEPGLYMLDCAMEGLMKTIIKYAPVAMEQPDNYEARANLMWASSWAINGFINGGRGLPWSCHMMEHEVSAVYDITHGLGLAIITPRWMDYVLDEKTLPKFCQFARNVFGVEASLPPMEQAKKGISLLSDFFFKTLGLTSRFSELGIDDSHFALMAEKAVKTGGLGKAFKPLAPQDVEAIFRRCL